MARAAAIGEAKWFRDAFLEHRAEVRKGFSEMATAAELATVRSEVRTGLATVQTEVDTLRTDVAALRTEVAAIRTDLNELRDSVDKGFAEVLDEVRKRPQ
jgi:hypothetical protein